MQRPRARSASGGRPTAGSSCSEVPAGTIHRDRGRDPRRRLPGPDRHRRPAFKFQVQVTGEVDRDMLLIAATVPVTYYSELRVSLGLADLLLGPGRRQAPLPAGPGFCRCQPE